MHARKGERDADEAALDTRRRQSEIHGGNRRRLRLPHHRWIAAPTPVACSSAQHRADEGATQTHQLGQRTVQRMQEALKAARLASVKTHMNRQGSGHLDLGQPGCEVAMLL